MNPSYLQHPKVKICGITTLEDAMVAVQNGADALGFVFFRKSPRYVDPRTVQHIVGQLPPFILPVGVFVNEETSAVRQIIDHCGIAIAQLHGDETPDYCEALGRPVLRAIRLRDRASFLALAEYKGHAGVRGFVIDAFSESAYGGTGQVVDWQLASEAAQAATTLLAGGLTPENVQEAIQKVQPYGVDVSSGIESQPGKKDPDKIQTFIKAAKLVS